MSVGLNQLTEQDAELAKIEEVTNEQEDLLLYFSDVFSASEIRSLY